MDYGTIILSKNVGDLTMENQSKLQAGGTTIIVTPLIVWLWNDVLNKLISSVDIEMPAVVAGIIGSLITLSFFYIKKNKET